MASGVVHHSTLVGELKSEHRELLATFGLLRHAAEERDAAGFRRALAAFKALLVPHLVKESFKVYTYLRQEYKAKGDLAVYDMVTAYKSEMTGIGDTALRFVESCDQMADDAIDFVQIDATLHTMGRLLGDRIRREEAELYPLYQTTH
jgi:regulator of sigma D